VRDVPRARPKRLFAPSATIVNSARMSTLDPSWRATVDPRTNPRSTIGWIASWPSSNLAPAATALSATIASRSRRLTT
jgi:hypothetical protein